jgi:hypothetical protein
MGLEKNRQRIFAKGIGNLEVKQVEPTSAAAFDNAGYIKSSTITDEFGMVDVQDETGNVVQSLPQTRKVTGEHQLMQSSAEEFALLTGASEKIHVVRYSGLTSSGKFQYFMFPSVRITPGFTAAYEVGERLLPLKYTAIIDSSLGYDVPPYVMVEAEREIRTANLQLFVDPKYDLNVATAKLLDLSGFGRHGTVSPSGDVATIWGQADILRFDGTDDAVAFGDVCNLDADDDFFLELWLRVPAANASAQEILAKKSASGTSAGYSLVRTSGNKIQAELGDGTDHPTVTSSADVLQNVWTHVALAGNRAGNAQLYINGAADGSAVSIVAVGDMTNAIDLTIAKLSTGYGQIDMGALRLYNFGASGLPSDIATIAARHYNAEKSHYGL